MQKTYSYEISDSTKEEMIEYFKDKKRDKTPQYAIFQAIEEDTIVTLYESNKVVFQGISADIDAQIWREKEYSLTGNYPLEKQKKEKKEREIEKFDIYFKNTIGSDEVGTGDYFGPIVVTASYVNKKDISYLEELGVKDSKKLTDEIILRIAPNIIKKIKHCSIILNNTDYNKYHSKEFNMNKIKSILHNKVLNKLLEKELIFDYIIVDQFTTPKSYYKYLEESKYIVKNITFVTKAESKNLAVACSSIISRYIFIKEMEKLSNMLNINLPYGATEEVDKIGKIILEKYSEEKLKEIAKLNFKNTEKIIKKSVDT